jgi:hypothetical protein
MLHIQHINWLIFWTRSTCVMEYITFISCHIFLQSIIERSLMYSTYSLDVASQLYYIDSMINTHRLSYAQYTEHHMIYLTIYVDWSQCINYLICLLYLIHSVYSIYVMELIHPLDWKNIQPGIHIKCLICVIYFVKPFS